MINDVAKIHWQNNNWINQLIVVYDIGQSTFFLYYSFFSFCCIIIYFTARISWEHFWIWVAQQCCMLSKALASANWLTATTTMRNAMTKHNQCLEVERGGMGQMNENYPFIIYFDICGEKWMNLNGCSVFLIYF